MRLRRTVSALLGAALFVASPARSGEPELALMPVSQTVVWDADLQVDVLAVNKTDTPMRFPLGAKVKARIQVESQSWPLMLLRERASQPQAPIPAGGFATVRYHASLPQKAHGRATLVVEEATGVKARAVIDIVGGGAAGPSPQGAWDGDFDHHRLLSGRLSIHQPIYLIVGPAHPEAKFQVSFKYRLSSFGGSDGTEPPHTLQVAYTQRSLWELGPFYDNSYMPEIMYQWLPAREQTLSGGGVTLLGVQAGWLHESNGRSGADERSANLAYVRPLISIGDADGWHGLLEPAAWFYFFGLKANPDLYIYRGNCSLRATVAKGSGVSLALTLLPGGHFSHGSRQLDLSIPVHIPFLDFSTYVMVQYYDGYAESLIDYRAHTSAVRAGLQFVR